MNKVLSLCDIHLQLQTTLCLSGAQLRRVGIGKQNFNVAFIWKYGVRLTFPSFSAGYPLAKVAWWTASSVEEW